MQRHRGHRIGTRIGIGLTSLLTVILIACVGPARQAVPVTTYLLSPDISVEPIEAGDRPPLGTLLVSMPEARAGFNTPRMAYMLRQHELQYYATSAWAETPARMLAPLLVQALEGTGAWTAVAQMPSSIRGHYRIDVDNVSLRQEFFDRPSQVRLELRAQFVDLRKQCVIGTQAFEVAEDASTDDAYGGVQAANRATGNLLQKVAGWLVRYLRTAPDGWCPT